MIYSFAEINPSIVFFILWGLLSWITKNRGKNAKLDNSKTISNDDVSDIDFDKEAYMKVSELQNRKPRIPTIVFEDGTYLVEPTDVELLDKIKSYQN